MRLSYDGSKICADFNCNNKAHKHFNRICFTLTKVCGNDGKKKKKMLKTTVFLANNQNSENCKKE